MTVTLILIAQLASFSTIIYLLNLKINSLKKELLNSKKDINTLHQNILMVFSNLKKINLLLRKNERKNSHSKKEISRKIGELGNGN